MDMKLRIVSVFILASPWAGVLQAADPQLLNLVMPDVKILAGVNVNTAKTSPFGQFLIAQAVNNQHLSEIITKTGFDPTRDLDELLLASNGAQSNPSHLVLALGIFDVNKIDTAGTAVGATSEVYKGITIVENPKRGDAFAILSSTLAVAGGVADVKGAIDRQTAPTVLDTALQTTITSLSPANDAWFVSLVPPPAINPPANAPNVPAVPSTVFQNVQQAQGGVKFALQGGAVLSAQLQADTSQNATALANVLQFLVNLGQMQTQQSSQAAAALKLVNISTSGQTVTVSATVTEDQLEAVIQSHAQPNVRQGPRPQRRL